MTLQHPTDEETKAQVRGAFLKIRQATVDNILRAETHQDMRQVLLDELREWCGWRENSEMVIDLLRVVEKLTAHLEGR